MSPPPIVLFPGARRKQPPHPVVVAPAILNSQNSDISSLIRGAADAAGLSSILLLAGAIAESGLNPRAERWGARTQEAKAAIEAGDWAKLDQIIAAAWPDISFGYGQQIVLYHYLGDHSKSRANCLAVRQGVFDDPQGNLEDMAKRLAANVGRAAAADLSLLGGDQLLGALVIYNAGSIHPAGDPWWAQWAGNVASYRAALQRAKSVLDL